MESQALRTAVRRLREVAAPPAAPAGADAELVRAFATRRDPAAFEQIVRRHGPMVLGVCRRVLSDWADADDAFQASFLVLVRRAGSLARPDRLAGWLHQVAHRTSRKLRAVRLTRGRRETELFDVSAGDAPAEIVWRELRPIFDAELDRLPDRLRLPAVLCLLEGRTKREAARALGWPEGTLSCRLQRARERLRARLASRGLTLSVGALAATLFEGFGAAAVPDRLIESTLQGVANPVLATGARALADGVTQAMFITKVKAFAAAVLIIGVVGTGTGVVLVPGSGPGEIVAAGPAKEGPRKEAPPIGQGANAAEMAAAQRLLDDARHRAVLADLQAKKIAQGVRAETENLRLALRQRIEALREIMEREAGLGKGGVPPSDRAEAIRKEIDTAESELKKLGVTPPADPDQAIRRQELELLKDRLQWEEKMVAKGYLAEPQMKKTRLELAKAEAALAKAEAPKPVEARRKALEATIQKLEQIVQQTRQGVERGVVPRQELLNSEITLETYKLKVLELDDRPAAGTGRVSPERRAAMERIVKKLEEIAATVKEGFDKGIVPQMELLHAQKTVLEHKFKLLEMEYAAEPRAAAPNPAIELDTRIEKAARDLARAQVLFRDQAISEDEVRRLNIELSRLRAEEAVATGNHVAAQDHLDVVVADMAARVAAVRTLVERKVASQAELRAMEVALAEVRVDALRAGVRRQLADIVAVREAELKDVRRLFGAKVVSAEEFRQAERLLAGARARLTAER